MISQNITTSTQKHKLIQHKWKEIQEKVEEPPAIHQLLIYQGLMTTSCTVSENSPV